MGYEDALKRWGQRRLAEREILVDASDVTVDVVSTEGFACCGGRDPDCYCSFAESPSFQVTVYYHVEDQKYNAWGYSADLFLGFEDFLRELLEEV